MSLDEELSRMRALMKASKAHPEFTASLRDAMLSVVVEISKTVDAVEALNKALAAENTSLKAEMARLTLATECPNLTTCACGRPAHYGIRCESCGGCTYLIHGIGKEQP